MRAYLAFFLLFLQPGGICPWMVDGPLARSRCERSEMLWMALQVDEGKGPRLGVPS